MAAVEGGLCLAFLLGRQVAARLGTASCMKDCRRLSASCFGFARKICVVRRINAPSVLFFVMASSKQVPLGPVFVGNFPATLVEPVIDELLSPAAFNDNAVKWELCAQALIAGPIEVGYQPAAARNANSGECGA